MSVYRIGASCLAVCRQSYRAMTVAAWGVLSISFVLSPCAAVAQQSPATNDRSEQLKHVFHKVASAYQVTAGTGGKLKQLPLHDAPIMHWLSLEGTTGSYVGSVFVWTHLGRPEVIGTLFTSDVAKERISICEEFYSFSFEPLVIRSGQGDAWRPAPSGTMQAIPDAPAPNATEQGRRRQIRTMARQFSGRMNRRGVPHPLRLLPRPVYQYDGDSPDILSGALFVLVAYTTDPDILLLIESRQTADGPKWFFQAARFSDKSLWLAYQEKDIWTSLRQGHGTEEPHAEDLQYHVEYVSVDAPLEPEDAASNTPPK